MGIALRGDARRNMKRVAVIGAGPAGLAAAYRLAQGGVPVVVFEGSNRVGGLSASLELWGQTVDLGPHRFFSTDGRVTGLWKEVVGEEFAWVERLTRIHYRGRFFDYPLRAGNALEGLGLWTAGVCVLSYLWAQVAPEKDESTFENWVKNRFGARLYEIFFRTYSERLWGIRCDELDADFAAQRIKKFSLFEAVRAALVGSGGRHLTLVDRFAYPLAGTGSVYRKMAERIVEMGGEVRLGAAVSGVEMVAGGGAIVRTGVGEAEGEEFDHVISSMPLTDLVRGLKPPPEIEACLEKLRYRNTVLVYLEVAGAGLFPDQWVYVHSPELAMGRVTNFRNWAPTICGKSPNTIVCLEYWCNDEDALWREAEGDLIARAGREMEATGLTRGAAILQGKVIRLRRSYPVYRRGYREYLGPVEQFVAGFPQLTAIGRYGSFKYNNQDHSLLMGVLAAENLLAGAGHDLWTVNTGEEYQESGRVKETGLTS